MGPTSYTIQYEAYQLSTQATHDLTEGGKHLWYGLEVRRWMRVTFGRIPVPSSSEMSDRGEPMEVNPKSMNKAPP